MFLFLNLVLRYYYQGYEDNILGPESGTRVNDEEPHCGRKALDNPDWIYIAGVTYIRPGVKGQEFNVQSFPQVKLFT